MQLKCIIDPTVNWNSLWIIRIVKFTKSILLQDVTYFISCLHIMTGSWATTDIMSAWPLVTSTEPKWNSISNPVIFPLFYAVWPLVSLSSSLFVSLIGSTFKILLYLINSTVNSLELPSLEFTLLIRVPEFHNQLTNDFDFGELSLCVNYWIFPFWILDSFFIPDTDVGLDLLSKFMLHWTLPSLLTTQFISLL